MDPLDAPGAKTPLGPFLDLLGASCTSAREGVAVVRLTLRPELCGRSAGAHAGVLTGLLDAAMAEAARSLDAGARDAVAIDLHPLFLRSAEGLLEATGRSTGGGRSVCFCEAELRDASGAVVARAMGTYRYRAADRCSDSTSHPTASRVPPATPAP